MDSLRIVHISELLKCGLVNLLYALGYASNMRLVRMNGRTIGNAIVEKLETAQQDRVDRDAIEEARLRGLTNAAARYWMVLRRVWMALVPLPPKRNSRGYTARTTRLRFKKWRVATPTCCMAPRWGGSRAC